MPTLTHRAGPSTPRVVTPGVYAHRCFDLRDHEKKAVPA